MNNESVIDVICYDENLKFSIFSPNCRRNCQCIVMPVAKKDGVLRDVNGELKAVLCESELRKLKIKIVGEDENMPAFDRIYVGKFVEVVFGRIVDYVCSREKNVDLRRDVVDGSVFFISHDGDVSKLDNSGRKIIVECDGYVSYVAKTKMIVTSIKWTVDEWGGKLQWEIEFEE